ncbi:hypothetical protein [Burkholderia contaminans]|uniref:hypothetical protein n=1 Tax=Burkholderia contaminans TaxID=488447 RepID=UPI00158AE53F|nr:hypothetical protein [Burkholderia contaminans]
MTPTEFLFHLKNLPEDTPITASHIAGILEVISPMLKEEKKLTDFDSLSASQLINENTLAEWICESVFTIQGWRVKGGIGPDYVKNKKGSVRYQVGAVRDWIKDNTISNTAQGTAKGIKRMEGVSFDFPTPLIVTTTEPEPVPFFQSLSLNEEVIKGYVMEHVEHYDEPQQNMAAWLYNQMGNGFLGDLKPQVKEFLLQGGKLNQVARRLVGDELIEFNIADLLANFQGIDFGYGDFLYMLLDNGLDVSQVSNPSDQFKSTHNSYLLYHKLEHSLSNKITATKKTNP